MHYHSLFLLLLFSFLQISLYFFARCLLFCCCFFLSLEISFLVSDKIFHLTNLRCVFILMVNNFVLIFLTFYFFFYIEILAKFYFSFGNSSVYCFGSGSYDSEEKNKMKVANFMNSFSHNPGCQVFAYKVF